MTTIPSLKNVFMKAVGARVLMGFLALQTLNAALPADAHAGSDGQGLHVGVKFLQTGNVKTSSAEKSSHGDTGESTHPIVVDDVPHFISGHAAAAADDHGSHASRQHKDYSAAQAIDGGHGSDTGSNHGGGKSSKYDHSRMMSVVFAHNGSYGDTSGFVDFKQKGSGINLYEARAATFLSFEKASGQDHFVGPVSDIGIIARIDHGHTPDHGSSLRYAVGPAANLANGKVRVGALIRDDLAQSGATGQISMTWDIPAEIAGREIAFSGYADAVGDEGKSSHHAVVKSEIWIKMDKNFYVGGYGKVKINADGIHGEHDFATGVGVKFTPF